MRVGIFVVVTSLLPSPTGKGTTENPKRVRSHSRVFSLPEALTIWSSQVGSQLCEHYSFLHPFVPSCISPFHTTNTTATRITASHINVSQSVSTTRVLLNYLCALHIKYLTKAIRSPRHENEQCESVWDVIGLLKREDQASPGVRQIGWTTVTSLNYSHRTTRLVRDSSKHLCYALLQPSLFLCISRFYILYSFHPSS